MRYKIESNMVIYGGIPNAKDWRVHLANLSLIDALVKMKNLLGSEALDFELNYIYNTNEDSMGCYNMYKISEDWTVETIFERLTRKEKTGIVVSSDEEIFYALEGNTTGGLDEQGKVEREGGGYYFTKRQRNPTGEMKVRGFIKPF